MLHQNIRTYRAAMIFDRSSDILLLNTTFIKTKLTGIAFLSCSGNIMLSRVYFFSNGHYNSSTPHYPAGASIEITDKNVRGNYVFGYCKFESVEAPMRVSDEHLNVTTHISNRGMGGGLGVFITGNCTNNAVSIEHSEFAKNQAHYGGGLHIQFQI